MMRWIVHHNYTLNSLLFLSLHASPILGRCAWLAPVRSLELAYTSYTINSISSCEIQ
nr:MAG TPA: hypothetical protein [Caudoviricetes sp.]